MTDKSNNKKFIWSSFPLFILAHAAHHLLTALPTPLLPAIRDEFKLSYTKASIVPMALSLSSATGQIPAGMLADRIDPAILITIGIVGVAFAGLFIGFSQTFIMMIAFLILMGLLSGGYHPAATPLISASVDPKYRGRALGVHLIGGNSSFFIAPIVAATISVMWGWRGAFLTLAVPAILFGTFFYFYLNSRGGRTHIENAKKSISEENPPQPGYKRRVIALLTMVVIGGGTAWSILAFLTLFLTDELGASNQLAGGLLSVIHFSGLWAGPLGGYISDRMGSVKVVLATGFFTGLMIYCFNFVTLGPSLYIVLFLIGFNMSVRMPVTEVFIMSQTPASHRSTIFGIYYSTMQYTGAIFTPIGGYLIERHGFHFCFNLASGIIVSVAIITGFFIWDAKDN